MNQCKPATLTERHRIEEMYVTMTAKEIAQVVGRPIGGIKEIIRFSDVRKNRRYTHDELELIKSDFSHEEVAKLIGRTSQEICTKRWVMGSKK